MKRFAWLFVVVAVLAVGAWVVYMNRGAIAQKLLQKFEGRENRAYLDSAGLWTIGIGHLVTPAERSVRMLGALRIRIVHWMNCGVLLTLR